AVEQLCYGLGVAAYTVFLLTTVKSEYKAAHYATATALMALGVMLPGAASGFLSTLLGYPNFFLLSFMSAIPGIAVIFFLPARALCFASHAMNPVLARLQQILAIADMPTHLQINLTRQLLSSLHLQVKRKSLPRPADHPPATFWEYPSGCGCSQQSG